VRTDLAPVSWPRMSRAVEKVQERLLRAVGALESAMVPYAVGEDHAVAAWVSRVDEAAVRNTRDVDILLRRSDFEAAKRALEGAGFIYRHVASLGQAGGLDIFLDGPKAGARDAVHVVFASEKVREDSLEAAPDIFESEEADQFRVLKLDALVRMKLTAFRDKDRTHLRDLIDVGLLNRSVLERLSGELRARMQLLFDTPEG
jgi:hypothetical protein